MGTFAFVQELALLLSSHHPIICIDGKEKDRAASYVAEAAQALHLPVYLWTRTKGLRAFSNGNPQHELAPIELRSSLTDPLDILQVIEQQGKENIYILEGFSELLKDEMVAAKMLDVGRTYLHKEGAVIVTGSTANISEALQPYTSRLPLPPPSDEELGKLIKSVYNNLSKKHPLTLHLRQTELDGIVRNLKGLSLVEAQQIISRVILEDKRLDGQDIYNTIKAKHRLLADSSVLEFVLLEETEAEVAGLGNLLAWLERRRRFLLEPERAAQYHLSFPSGVLLTGVPGCGKSLCAKVIASRWALPLLRLNPASLLNKYIGESEKRFQDALEAAERLAPAVLWVDEIEKALHQGSESDSGVSQRLLGVFLSWLQEKKAQVFVLATANDIGRLPAELLRKGRFDELFFVDLPRQASREELFRLHLRKRRQDLEHFDSARLAQLSEGFSGAEIEQAIVSALYQAFDDESRLCQQSIEDELASTRPLSQTMAERITGLRQWAQERAVFAE